MTGFKNHLKTFILLGGLSSLIVVLGAAAGEGYAYLALGFAFVLNVGAYFFSDKIVLAMHRAQEVTPQEQPVLHRIVEELALKAQIPKPKVCILPGHAPNAFATGRNPEHGVVAVTQGLLQLLTEREVRGVLAHEIAHIKNRDILIATVASVVAAAITHLATGIQWMGLLGRSQDDEEGGGFSGLLLAFIAPIVAMLIQFAISRTREYMADATGAKLSDDPEALASALEKLERGVAYAHEPSEPATASMFIVSPFTGVKSFMEWFSTHPRTEQRVQRLREMSVRRG